MSSGLFNALIKSDSSARLLASTSGGSFRASASRLATSWRRLMVPASGGKSTRESLSVGPCLRALSMHATIRLPVVRPGALRQSLDVSQRRRVGGGVRRQCDQHLVGQEVPAWDIAGHGLRLAPLAERAEHRMMRRRQCTAPPNPSDRPLPAVCRTPARGVEVRTLLRARPHGRAPPVLVTAAGAWATDTPRPTRRNEAAPMTADAGASRNGFRPCPGPRPAALPPGCDSRARNRDLRTRRQAGYRTHLAAWRWSALPAPPGPRRRRASA